MLHNFMIWAGFMCFFLLFLNYLDYRP